MFKLGRTDTIRSASIDSANFVKAFDEPARQVRETTQFKIEAKDDYSNSYNNQCLILHDTRMCVLFVMPTWELYTNLQMFKCRE